MFKSRYISKEDYLLRYLVVMIMYIYHTDNYQVTDNTPGSALAAGDDPHQWAPGVDHIWRVTDKLQTGIREASGNHTLCSPFVFSQGDFVDVGITFDIATTRQPNGRLRNHVHLSIVHILQLRASILPEPVRPINLQCSKSHYFRRRTGLQQCENRVLVWQRARPRL